MPSLPDRAADEEASRALTQAHLQFRRGQLSEAELAVQSLIAAKPSDAGAMELLGDIRQAQNDLLRALESYQAALKIEPGRPTAETKLGRATLRAAEQQRMKTLGVAYAASETGLVRSSVGGQNKRSSKFQVLGTALCPGLGQIISGQYLKGGILVGVFLLGLSLLAALSNPSPALAEHSGTPIFSAADWLVVGVIVVDWVYAVTDSALAVSRTSLDSDSERDGWQV